MLSRSFLLYLAYLLLTACSACTSSQVNQTVNAPDASSPPIGEYVDYSDNYSFKNIDLMKKDEVERLARTIQKKDGCSKFDCDILPKKEKSKVNGKSYPSFKNYSDWEKNDYEFNLRQIRKKKDSELVSIFKKNSSNKDLSCPKNMTAAIIKVVDPEIETVHPIENLDLMYSSMGSCESNVSLEQVHLKMAILYNYFKMPEKAAIAIKKILAEDSIQDYSRVNYWAGIILNDKKYWNDILEQRPYSFHATEVAKEMSINLYEKMKNKPLIHEKRLDNNLSKYVENLLYYKKYTEAYLLVSYNLNKMTVQNALYYAKLFDKKSVDSETIKIITRIAQFFPSQFNYQFIEISYKINYLENFEKYSKIVDPYLMISLSKQESGFNPLAKSKANAYGLMQLLKSTAKSVSKEKSKNIYDPDCNIYLGVNYYKTLQDTFGEPQYALAAYNAGPKNVEKWVKKNPKDRMYFMDLIPFKETKIYVASIMRNNYYYREVLKDKKKIAK